MKSEGCVHSAAATNNITRSEPTPQLGRMLAWECPCGQEPPKEGSSLVPVATFVSLREPFCLFCGRPYEKRLGIEKRAAAARVLGRAEPSLPFSGDDPGVPEAAA